MNFLEELANLGITVSFCYGPSGNKEILWSVNAMKDFEELNEKPFGANSFEHCIEILKIKCKENGWIND